MTSRPARGNLPEGDLQEILDISRLKLNNLASSKILICGATGFVGTWLTSSLLEANEEMNLDIEIVIISRDIQQARKKLSPRASDPLRILEGDLASQVSPLKNLEREFTHIVHLATPTVASTGSLNLEGRYRSTVEGANNMVEFAAKMLVPPVLVHTSSGAVYGRQPLSVERIKEGWKNANLENEISAYGRAKLEAEQLISRASEAGQVRAANPRLFAFLGPHLAMDAHFAVGNFMQDALLGRDIRVEGNPSTTRSYLYPTDLTNGLLAILADPRDVVLHLGSRIPVQISDLAKAVSVVFNDNPISYLAKDAVPSHYVPETLAMRTIYGVDQRVSLTEGIQRWAHWLKSV